MISLIEEAKSRGFGIYINNNNKGIPDYACAAHYIILGPNMTNEEIRSRIESKYKEFEGKEWYFEVNGLKPKKTTTEQTYKQTVEQSDAYQVYATIESERRYQLANEDKSGSHITSSLNMGGILTAIQYNLNKAQESWYNEKEPYQKTTDFLRKIAALCVKAGEDYGMKNRK